jgi:CRISPR system Cascade subunit CasE
MFLTRLAMNPARRDARRLAGNPHAMHAAVMAAFSPEVHAVRDREGRILWRLDARAPALTLYLVSPHEPDLTHLVESAGWPATEGWQTRSYLPLLDRLAVDQPWRFRVTGNPVRRETTPAGRTKVHPHVTAAQQEMWLAERLPRHGFDALKGEDGQPLLQAVERKTVRFPREGKFVTLVQATFEGLVTVTDPVAARACLVNGLGRAKGYGCGLLTLAGANA